MLDYDVPRPQVIGVQAKSTANIFIKDSKVKEEKCRSGLISKKGGLISTRVGTKIDK